jgi:predicted CoA-binding protein
MREKIAAFLNGEPHAVVGASRDRAKFGNQVFRAYVQHGRRAFPINPNAMQIEGVVAYRDLASLPEKVHGISVITRPDITDSIIEQAAKLGIEHIWLQPGAENVSAIARAAELNIQLIYGGPCLLMELGFRD